jgi:hypothetical protein
MGVVRKMPRALKMATQPILHLQDFLHHPPSDRLRGHLPRKGEGWSALVAGLKIKESERLLAALRGSPNAPPPAEVSPPAAQSAR